MSYSPRPKNSFSLLALFWPSQTNKKEEERNTFHSMRFVLAAHWPFLMQEERKEERRE
jgi:hypothetical protein